MTPSPATAKLSPRSERLALAQRLAELQAGPIGREQLLDRGIPRKTIDRWIQAGILISHLPGVYTLGSRLLSDEGRLVAALLYAGPGSALSHTAAGWWLGILEGELSEIHVSTPNQPAERDGLIIHRPRRVETVRHRRLPLLPVPQIFLGMATLLDHRALRKAVADAEFKRRVAIDQLREVLGRGTPGSAALRQAINAHQPELARTASELEILFVELCENARLPVPELNRRIEGFLVDAVWRGQRVVVELDGGQAHGTPAAVARDRQRDLILRAAGWTVRRYGWSQVTRTQHLVAVDLRPLLA